MRLSWERRPKGLFKVMGSVIARMGRGQQVEMWAGLEALAVEVVTALGDAAVRDAERRADCALLAMTEDEGSVGSQGRRLVWQRHSAGGDPAAPPDGLDTS